MARQERKVIGHPNLYRMIGFGWIGMIAFIHPALADDGNAETALRFLKAGNATEAVGVKNIRVVQHGRPLPMYESIGREERNAQLGRRPILLKIQPERYFVRGKDWVALVDRSLPLKLEFSMEWIRFYGLNRQSLAIQPVTEVFVYLTPGAKEEIALKSNDGSYGLDVSPGQKVRSICLQMRSGNERHEIKLVLISREKPVTFSKDANHIDNPAAE